MDFQKLFQRISLQPEAAECFFAIHRRSGDVDFDRRLAQSYEVYRRGDDAFGAFLQDFAEAEGLRPEILNLYIYLRMSEKTLERYRSRGIGEDVFYETMLIFPICCQVCHDANGIYGIAQAIYRPWVRRILDCRIYRLGRLEFELTQMDADVEIEGYPVLRGTTVLSTHIPRYLPLTEAACEASYARARAFFREYYGMEKCVFICDSWLLHPWLRECLGKDSAILKFQRKYRLLRVEDNIPVAVQWIFPGYEGRHVSEFPLDTTLRRAAVEHIKQGLSIGTALGIRL